MFNLKKCYTCKLEKPYEFFGKSNRKDGLYPQCKSCVSKINRDMRLKRKNEILLNGFIKIEHKICTQCKEQKLIEQFYKRSDSKDGYDFYCKTCDKINIKKLIVRRQLEIEKRENSQVVLETQKTCCSCNVEKSNNDFYKNKKSLDGLSSYCKRCRKNKSFLKNYGFGIEIFEKMYKEKNGLCDICKQFIEKEKICIDHNHSTGQVRGLLCRVCNTSLGAMKENINLLKNMIKYIIFWNR